MSTISIFAPLAKVEATSDGGREVSGYATLEKADKANQIADYESTVEAFKVWSEEIQAASMGKSMGNCREMHQPKAVGKVIDWFPSEKLEKDDSGNENLVKGIYVTVRVPPSQAETIEKLDEGILTGFSIGGKYAKKWMDVSSGKMRYTPKLSELSLVDNPAVPGATYDVVKGDAIVLGNEETLEKKALGGSFEDLRNRISAACEAKFKGASNYWDGYTVATFTDKVIVYNYDSGKYFEVPYTVGDPDKDGDSDIILGEETEVEQTYVPVSVQKFVEAELQKRAQEKAAAEELAKASGVTDPSGKEEEKPVNELLKALLEAKQSGALNQILEELKKMDTPAVEPPKAEDPPKQEDPLAKSEEPPKTEEPPAHEDLTKVSGTEDLAKYNVAVSAQRMAHLEHARRHIQAAMTGGDYTPDDHTAVEGAAISDGSGAEDEVVSKLIGSSLQKMANFAFEEDLTKFDLAKASEVAKLGTSITEALDLLKGYDTRLKAIEEQPSGATPPMMNGYGAPMFKFQGEGEPDPTQSRQYLEELKKNEAIPLSVRQRIGVDLAKMDSPFYSR